VFFETASTLAALVLIFVVFFPVPLIMPTPVSAVPIAMVLAPAMFPFFIQLMTAALCSLTVLPILMNGLIQTMLSFFNAVATFVVIVIGACQRNGR
jgi:hypothetical protein